MKLAKSLLVAGFALGVMTTSAMADDPISSTGKGAESILDGVSGFVNNVATGAGKGFTNVLDNVSGRRNSAQYSAPAAQPSVAHHHRRHR